MGKGVVGLVTRPAGGVVDFASGTFDTVKRATEVNDEFVRTRAARWRVMSLLDILPVILPVFHPVLLYGFPNFHPVFHPVKLHVPSCHSSC